MTFSPVDDNLTFESCRLDFSVFAPPATAAGEKVAQRGISTKAR
jgi:hypothetical protein